jgi:hypothetical protein
MTSEGFQGYPENHVLAAFDSRADAAAALDDLREEGLAEDEVAVYAGEDGADEIDSDGTSHGLGSTIIRSVQGILTDRDRLVEYEEAVEQGGVVIAAQSEDDERKHLLAAVFKRHGGHDVHHFGAMTVENLSADPSRTRMD